jgi:transcriptional regulator with XRE-family HTH domain
MRSIKNRTIEQKALARVICTIRKTKHLKREYLAEILALSVGSIDKIEQGKTHLRFTDAIRLCEVLQIDIQQLMHHYRQELLKLYPPPPPRRNTLIKLAW